MPSNWPDMGFDIDDDGPAYSPGDHGSPRGNDLPVRPAARVLGSVNELDMDKELAHQYAEATSYRDWLLQNEASFAPNHIVAGIRAVETTLKNIITLQEKVQDMARMKAVEDTVIEVMKLQPEKVRNEFFALLDTRLSKKAV